MWAGIRKSPFVDGLCSFLGMAESASIQEIKTLKEELKIAKEREKQKEALLDSIANYAICMLTPDGTVVSWSSGGRNVNGYRPEHIIGKSVSILFVEEDVRRGIIEDMKRSATGNRTFKREMRCRNRDGTEFIASISLSSIKDNDGKLMGYAMVTSDITKRRSAEEYREYLLHLNQTITMNAAEALFMVDECGRCVFMNPAAEKMIGYSEADVQGRNLREILRYEQPNGQPFPLEFCPFRSMGIREPKIIKQEGFVKHRDGRSIAVIVSASPTLKNGNINETVCVVHDISEQKRLYEDLQRSQAALLESERSLTQQNKGKDAFLAVLSHELRTPLTPMLASLDGMLRFNQVPEDMRPEIEMLRRNIQLETTLIDDLLDVTRISNHKLALKITDVNVHDLIRVVINLCVVDIDNKKLQVTTDKSATRAYVKGDPARLQQVLWNLLKNAVKFSNKHGSILIRTENEGDSVRIQVIDQGKGITADALPKIFHPFDQGDLDAGSTVGGLGLGLSICKSLIDLHHGEIHAFSEGRYRGATFTVDLPLSKVTTPVQAVVPLPVERKPATGLTILLVEDHEDTRNSLAKLLAWGGYKVTQASTFHAAVSLLKENTYDVLITDVGLPDGSGHDILQTVPDVPIRAIALTGFGQQEDIDKSLRMGFLQHMTKPVNFDSLIDVISKVLKEPLLITKAAQVA